MLVIVCPGCGHSNKDMKHVPRNMQFTCSKCGGHVARIHRHYKGWLTRLVERAPPREQAMRDTYAGLLYVADAKGYKEGFAAVKYRLIYHCWPNGFGRLMEPPREELKDWLEAEKRHYKAERKREEKERQGQGNLVVFNGGNGRTAQADGEHDEGNAGNGSPADSGRKTSNLAFFGRRVSGEPDSEFMDPEDYAAFG